jgi:hypothetical protein
MTHGVIPTCFWVVSLCGFSAEVCLCGDITGLFLVHNCINNLHTSIMAQQWKNAQCRLWHNYNAIIKVTRSYFVNQGSSIFQKCSSHSKILGARKVTWSKFHIADPQIFYATIQNLVAWATWQPGFVHPCNRLYNTVSSSCMWALLYIFSTNINNITGLVELQPFNSISCTA